MSLTSPLLHHHHHHHHHHLLVVVLLLLLATAAVGAGGRWDLLQRSIGVSAMHMQLLHNDRVIIFDRTDYGPSNLSLPFGRCRNDSNDLTLKHDCTAHSVEYNVSSNSFRPLTVLTDTWCSSGTVSPDGRLVQTGGYNDGDHVARTFTPCDDNNCDWVETPNNNALTVRRWYATNQILPDGRAIVVGGRRQFNYEFYPKSTGSSAAVALPFLRQTNDVAEENNLYPFLHLNVDGNLFIFANNRAILFDYRNNVVVRNYPQMPGGEPRNYPSSGSSVLLPLKTSTEAEVLVCGGAPIGSFTKASKNKTYLPALSTCGKIKITDESPVWAMEQMPGGRVMGDMVLLPSGAEVLIVNGAATGTAGWEDGPEPVLSPVVYRPDSLLGLRFAMQNPTATPRLYHSTAILLRDGRVLIGGSNPHVYYNFTGVDYPTDLSLEAFSPDYMASENSASRPKIVTAGSPLQLGYGKRFALQFHASVMNGAVSVTMVAPSFTTHSFSMNQRLLILVSGNATAAGSEIYNVEAVAPASGVLAPAGYYMVFVVNCGIPSEGIWAHIQ